MNLSFTARLIVFLLLIIAGALLVYRLVNSRGSSYQTVDLTKIDQMIENGSLKELTVKRSEIVAIDNNGQEYRTALSNEQVKTDLIKKAGEVVNGKPRVVKIEESGNSYIWPMLITWSPLLFIIIIVLGIFVLLPRQLS